MAKYDRFTSPQSKPAPWKIHPIWQGIGCIMMVMIPILSYIGAVLLYEENARQNWLPNPAELSQTVIIPVIGYAVPHLWGSVVLTALLMLFGFGAFTLIYAIIYQIAGPSRYGPLDAPPRRSGKRKKRL